MLAGSGARVLVPVHPGFGGTPRPDYLRSMRGLALTYTRLLDELNLTGVVVIGNSIGGWIAAEMAVHASARIDRVVLVDAGLRDYTAQGMTDPELLGLLGAVKVPVLVVWGEADRIYPMAHGEAFAKAIPGAQLVTIREAGHLPQLEAPEALLAAIQAFR